MEVYTGEFPKVAIQSSCRCPPTHPRVKPLSTHLCISNGVADNTGDEILRLHNDSHPLAYLNDGDSNSMWVSAFLSDVTIEVDLGDQFQVRTLTLYESSSQHKTFRNLTLIKSVYDVQLFAVPYMHSFCSCCTKHSV